MNIWLKSILIGLLGSIVIYFLSRSLYKTNNHGNYKVEYLLKIKYADNVNRESVLAGLIEIIEKRFKAAIYVYEIEEIAIDTLFIRIFNVKDTVLSKNITKANARMQFCELYSINEITNLLTEADKIANKLFPEVDQKDFIRSSKDSMSKNVSLLLDSLNAYEQRENSKKQGIGRLINFSAYHQTNGSIGEVLIEDTAKVGDILRSESVLNNSPADMHYCFGSDSPEISLGSNSKNKALFLYFIKTNGNLKAPLENEDIFSASMDFNPTNGNPEVNFRLTRDGSDKWRNLTRKNVNKFIAIVFDNYVISAPRVQSEIEGGNVTLSGNFSYTEAETLANILNSKPFPADLSLINSKILNENRSKRIKNILIYLSVFLGISILSFVIFRIFKSN